MAMSSGMSKTEKKMLIILGIIVMAFAYYQFYNLFFGKLIKNADDKKTQTEAKYDYVMDTISKMNVQKNKLIVLNSDIETTSKPYYPTLSEEHIINEIDKLYKECNLYGGFEFKPIECKMPNSMEKSEIDIGKSEGSIAGDAVQYEEKFNKRNKKDKDKKTEQNDSSSDSDSSEEDKDGLKVLKMEGTLKCYGSYENITKFVKMLDEREKKLCLYGFGECDLNEEDDNFLKVSIGMVAYAVPKINNEKERYLMWNIKDTYGKKEPFIYSSSSDGGISNDKPEEDFIVKARSVSSDMPAITVGKVDDTFRSSYAYSSNDGNGRENITIEINEINGKYYYKCSTNKDSIPKNSGLFGKEFVPFGNNIKVNVTSEKRISDDDKYKAELNIINNTNKKVFVKINDDDSRNPRISVKGSRKNVIVEKE